MWVWEHALFNYNPKRPDSTKKDKTVEVITKADHDAALRRAKAEGMREAAIRAREFSKPYSMEWWRTMTKTGISAAMCRDVADALDAHAAQIEEGE